MNLSVSVIILFFTVTSWSSYPYNRVLCAPKAFTPLYTSVHMLPDEDFNANTMDSYSPQATHFHFSMC